VFDVQVCRECNKLDADQPVVQVDLDPRHPLAVTITSKPKHPKRGVLRHSADL